MSDKPTVVSLFAGIGGFDLGFQQAGFNVVAHVEKDANCRKLLATKWNDAVVLDDVCTAGKHNLPSCDVVTFGFPCQDLSVAGKRAGLAGGRSGLFYEATRIINEIKPAFCLFENVPGLLSSDRGRDFARVLMEMDKIGYHGAWRCLDAQWFGVAQRRRRIFGLFSSLDSGAERCAEILSIQESLGGHPAPSRETGQGSTYSVAPCLAASGRGTERAGETRGQDCVIPSVMPTLRSGAEGHGARSGDCKDEYIIPVVAGCLQANYGYKWGLDNQHVDAGCPMFVFAQLGMQVRRLTPTECEKLQGFPVGWTEGFSDSTRYKMLGNAVCVSVSRWIAQRMIKQCEEVLDSSKSDVSITENKGGGNV